MVGQEARIHAAHKHGAESEQRHGQVGVATHVGDAEQADGGGYGGCDRVNKNMFKNMN